MQTQHLLVRVVDYCRQHACAVVLAGLGREIRLRIVPVERASISGIREQAVRIPVRDGGVRA